VGYSLHWSSVVTSPWATHPASAAGLGAKAAWQPPFAFCGQSLAGTGHPVSAHFFKALMAARASGAIWVLTGGWSVPLYSLAISAQMSLSSSIRS
jgi:hypothetical protein